MGGKWPFMLMLVDPDDELLFDDPDDPAAASLFSKRAPLSFVTAGVAAAVFLFNPSDLLTSFSLLLSVRRPFVVAVAVVVVLVVVVGG